MSQTTEKSDINIEVFITLDDQKEPQAVTVSGTGNIPLPSVRAIAAEALESHFGSVSHGYRVHLFPVLEEDETKVFELYR